MKYGLNLVYSDKLDGISALIHKTKNGLHLFKRGDGINGTDISYLIPYINITNIDKMEYG